MDGIGEVYNQVRLRGDFNFFEANLKKIVELTNGTDTDVMLNVVIVKENYHQMSEMIEYAHANGIKYT